MLKNQVGLKEAEGKTIKEVFTDWKTLVIMYKDNTFSALSCTQGYEGSIELTQSVEIEEIEDWVAELNLEDAYNEHIESMKRCQEQYERSEYVRLKRKFEK